MFRRIYHSPYRFRLAEIGASRRSEPPGDRSLPEIGASRRSEYTAALVFGNDQSGFSQAEAGVRKPASSLMRRINRVDPRLVSSDLRSSSFFFRFRKVRHLQFRFLVFAIVALSDCVNSNAKSYIHVHHLIFLQISPHVYADSVSNCSFTVYKQV